MAADHPRVSDPFADLTSVFGPSAGNLNASNGSAPLRPNTAYPTPQSTNASNRDSNPFSAGFMPESNFNQTWSTSTVDQSNVQSDVWQTGWSNGNPTPQQNHFNTPSLWTNNTHNDAPSSADTTNILTPFRPSLKSTDPFADLMSNNLPPKPTIPYDPKPQLSLAELVSFDEPLNDSMDDRDPFSAALAKASVQSSSASDVSKTDSGSNPFDSNPFASPAWVSFDSTSPISNQPPIPSSKNNNNQNIPQRPARAFTANDIAGLDISDESSKSVPNWHSAVLQRNTDTSSRDRRVSLRTTDAVLSFRAKIVAAADSISPSASSSSDIFDESPPPLPTRPRRTNTVKIQDSDELKPPAEIVIEGTHDSDDDADDDTNSSRSLSGSIARAPSPLPRPVSPRHSTGSIGDATTLRIIQPSFADVNHHPPIAARGGIVDRIKHKGPIKTLALSGKALSTGTSNIRVWSLSTGENVRTVPLNDVKIMAIAVCPFVADESVIWVGRSDGRLLRVDVTAGSIIDDIEKAHHTSSVSHIIVGASLVVTISVDGNAQLWTKKDKLASISSYRQLNMRSQNIAARSTNVVLVSEGAELQLWMALNRTIEVCVGDNLSYKRKMEATLMVGLISAITADKYRGIVYTGHEDGKLLVWSVSDYSQTAVIPLDRGRILSMESVGTHLWVGLADGNIIVLNCNDWAVIKEWRAHNSGVMHLQQSTEPTIPIILSASEQGSVLLWDALLSEDWIDKELRSHANSFCSYSPLEVFICSWNVAARKPHDYSILQNLVKNATQQPDIIVFGLQEIVDLEIKKKNAKSLVKEFINTDDNAAKNWSAAFLAAARRAFPAANYLLIEQKNMVGLLIAVLTRRELVATDVASVSVKTGLGGLHGNKGSVGVRLIVNDSSFCFLNCHLAAGHSQFKERLNDAAIIYREASFPTRNGDALVFVNGGDGSLFADHEFCFFFGDLNFRIDLPNDQVRRMAESIEFSGLIAYDQLKKLISASVLQGYSEGPLIFPPTYKYDIGTDTYDTSDKRRVPAWCDRILWKGENASLQGYGRAEFKLSDHKPVWGLFRAQTKSLDASKRAPFVAAAREAFEREIAARLTFMQEQKLGLAAGVSTDRASSALKATAGLGPGAAYAWLRRNT